ncbi:MAG: PhoX family phosphatase [Alcanivoracaceae bacterium]|jgi:secreted PhoX family phosphatase|nr:PhoX family phosphatase [Alcanivoracaceae bacterium]
MKDLLDEHVRFHSGQEEQDDITVNPSSNPSLNDLIRYRRRDFLKGSLGLAAISFVAGGVAGCQSRGGILGFEAVEQQFAEDFDQVIVPRGYRARPFFSWGDAVTEGVASWQEDASNSWEDQLGQAGQNHDGMHYFPFDDAPDSHALLVINHEYANPTLHRNGFTWRENVRPLDQVRKEQAAHGVSIIEIRKDSQGHWQRVFPSPLNRRISAMTRMAISGPLASHELVKTVADPDGREVIGTLNNCAMGWTPWRTYLACEENWHKYFVNRAPGDYMQRTSHRRYGVTLGGVAEKYGWNTADERFDATPDPEQPFSGYVNEPNRFGWVVEIDPFDPESMPVKRTALGRFCRECCVLSLADNGRMAYYSGDDSRGEYIYKFVPDGRYIEGDREHNSRILDAGVLYVARFNSDGSGEWLPLIYGQNDLTADNGFADQAEVLVNARAAADVVGATPMDRPEWVAIDPFTREVYVTLTNNVKRGGVFELNAANPRRNNVHGQIVRWSEQDRDPTATRFRWDIFLLAGEREGSIDATGKPFADNLTGTIKGDIFSSPDGLGFDKDGRLWIETDYDDSAPEMQSMGCNQLLCADPASREVRRFLVGPRGCEITGLAFSPDGCSLWVNIQHPAISYPASDGATRPRSTTVLITKDDGGVIGS